MNRLSTPPLATVSRTRAIARRASVGFTLVELLIVVAILALLAAIAVPNFLEAQIRTKVSRAKADMRTLATGLEAYRVDANTYPIVGNPSFPNFGDLYVPLEKRLVALTTPIAYTTSIPEDPFAGPNQESVAGLGMTYVYAPGNLYHGSTSLYSGTDYRGSIFSLSSRGPDRNIYFGGYCMAHPTARENKSDVLGSYDPTNGTVSEGDVLRLGSGVK